jgi:HlyD family secretion protein
MKSKRNKIPVIAGVVLVIILAIVGFAFNQNRKAGQAKNTAKYDIVQAKRMDLSEKVDATGDIITEKNGSLYSPYSATVWQILAKPGDVVHKGDLLLVLQMKDADLINYAAGYKSSLEQAKNNLLVAQNALIRQQALYKIQGTTIGELENAQKAVQQYQAQVSEYTLKVQSLTKNGVDQDNNILIKAPFDAEVSWINVKEAQSVSITDELLTLGGASAIRVEADVDQGDISQIKEGQRALITANDENRSVIPGVVTSFGSTGTTNSSVVTFPVVIKPLGAGSPGINGIGRENLNTQNKRSQYRSNNAGKIRGPQQERTGFMNRPAQNIGKLLKTGMTVDVTIMVDSHPSVLAIPLRSVTQINGQSVVKVLKQGKYVTQKVKLGFTADKYVEVLSGLAEGDQVAVPQAQFMNNGMNPSNSRGNSGRMRFGGPMGH